MQVLRRILIVEDNEDDFLLVERTLRRTYELLECERVDSPTAMRSALARQDWDAVISEYALPSFTGLSALAVLQESGLDLPFIIVSGAVGEERAVEAMKQGAHDYVMKGSLARLAPALDRELREAEQRQARKRAELEVSLLSLAVSQSASMVIVTNATGAISYVNEAFLQCTGYKPEQLLGLNWDLLPSTDISTLSKENVAAVLRRGDTYHGELLTRKVSGESFWTDARISPVRNPSGTLLGYMLVQEDITERKRLESELMRYTSQLEQMVEERTTELRRAKEEAENANRAKSDFLANMNHELRTPLNAILGFAYLLRNAEGMPPDQQEHLNIIYRSGQHLLELIGDLLDLAKIEAGRMTVSEAPFDPYLLVSEIEQIVEPRAAEKSLTLCVELAPDMPQYVISDQRKIRQILLNLLSNAIKFTQAGGISLRLSYMPYHEAPAPHETGPHPADRQDSLGFLIGEVSDTGPGISPEEMKMLFQPFSQTSSGRNTQQGTGLGLAITRQFVNLLGGSIHVESHPGQGTTFVFSVRIKATSFEVEDSQSSGAYATQPSTDSVPVELQERRVLWVSRSEEIGSLFNELLAPLKLSIRQAVDEAQAVAIGTLWQPHLALLDTSETGGTSIATRLRCTSGFSQTALIALISGSAFSNNDQDRTWVKVSGFDGYLLTPVTRSGLLLALRYYFGTQVAYPLLDNSTKRTELAKLTAEDLRGLPEEWVEKLNKLAMMADSKRLLMQIGEIQESHPALYQALTVMVRSYNLEALLALTAHT